MTREEICEEIEKMKEDWPNNEKIDYETVKRMMEKPVSDYRFRELKKRVDWLMIIVGINAITMALYIANM